MTARIPNPPFGPPPQGINSIGIIPYGFDDLSGVYNGAGLWNNSCWEGPNSGVHRPIPTFQVGLTGDWTVSITLQEGHAGTVNPVTGTYPAGRSFRGEIVIYKLAGPPDALVSTLWNYPEWMAALVAHELGHQLGLRDSSCGGDVMQSPI
jgi:hypothetical protein